jgi:hypothetical protein
VTFSTWALATAHYTECLLDGSVRIQRALEPQTPINGPAQKKRRSVFKSPYSPLLFPASLPTPKPTAKRRNPPLSSCEQLIPNPVVKKYAVYRQKHRLTRAEARIRAAQPIPPLSLLSLFASRAQPFRHVYVDDKSDEEGEYAALVRLATATPIARHSTPISVHSSDSEYAVSDIKLTDDILKVLNAPVHPTTAALSARVTPSSSVVVERRSSAIVIHASDSEYDLSDIELDDNTFRLLDQID